MNRTKSIIYWIATGIVAFILVGSAFAKLAGGDQAAEIAKNVGSATKVTILGILELIIVALWIIRRTGVVGALLAIAYLGGAIAVHFISNQSLIAPVIIQIIVWIAFAVRFPEVTQRLLSTSSRN